jgi:hypothetical protein
MYVPINATGNYHPEFESYPFGSQVKQVRPISDWGGGLSSAHVSMQADTILMGYPGHYGMSPHLRKGDLTYYESVTDINGIRMKP